MAFSIRLTEDERKLATAYADLHTMSLGEAFKQALFERIEDEYDVVLGEDALNDYAADGYKSRPIGELWEECGI
ncbi:MAG: DUF6290 family protein [Mobiluncus porci]|uniref:Antitoxin n=1 Tax=Mobiluncus porci TaxID=2652278 RepID=A0A7K0K0E1_9ACTO|nr:MULTISPECIES: DUF6290 family protein [Mobiluncus]MCI6585027.1 DUF6290 family protein [Mobiluncus sp.]MDD7541644.1 DUF6290 family protein [Mobiluncus porci]MDY5748116.1 DUF6290 family protein [Mobiluncus porci]MST48956.1 antitoxin [Mobiluncus porci]